MPKKKSERPLAAREIREFVRQLESEDRSDRAWRAMTSPEPEERADAWSGVEEHLLRRHHDEDQKLKRWKHFG